MDHIGYFHRDLSRAPARQRDISDMNQEVPKEIFLKIYMSLPGSPCKNS